MWKVLIPIILLVIAILFQLQVRETFVSTTTKDTSGNEVDASGNTVSQSQTSMISLTLADLLNLFKSSSEPTAATGAAGSGGGTTSTLFYTTTTTLPATNNNSASSSSETSNDYTKGSSSTVDGVSSSNLPASPYTPSAPIPSEAPCSDSAAQGVEYQTAVQDYIRKDEIPCYGCTL